MPKIRIFWKNALKSTLRRGKGANPCWPPAAETSALLFQPTDIRRMCVSNVKQFCYFAK